MNSQLLTGTLWSFFQRFGSLAISFVSNMVLARLLCPEDFGTIGLIMVFVGLADVLVDGGLGNALIQKKELDKNDISTVFTSNLVISLILFGLIFIFAPAIERYTGVERFAVYLRVESVMVLLRALYVVHYSLINKKLDFKELALINVVASVLSVVVAISMALAGCGIWSLICRNIVLDLSLLCIYSCKFKINLRPGFDGKAFKQLFSFGIFVAASNLLESLYGNIITFFIGKKYTVKELGYYNQAYSLEQIPVYSMTAVLNQVLFPFFSKIQDAKDKVKDTMKMSIETVAFCVYPIMIYLICFAKPIIVMLYSDKWLPSVPYFQLLCLSGLFNALIHINRSVLKSMGCSKLLFKAQLLLCAGGMALIFIGLQFSLRTLVMFIVLNSLISFLVTAGFAGKRISYSVLHQIKDVLPYLVMSLLVGVVCFFTLKSVTLPNIALIILGFVFFAFLYLLLNWIFKTSAFKTISPIVFQYINKNK